ncbi:hypothetical protein VA7868_00787 [Vibrio aerogenes CECT 7868]|uniref:DUF1127 domain-containing protein n=1 Tax=Vibrio aerogenes CECT 7868 TaxID=1216006 RepID=A0A1M5WM47_9VIBR|nr:DUF1127 domain-containing protein [Vibrio aerogenes]SHH88596.1 hypothetical protein VA7868_00787 [Vibrio aerogenes CECT 7868]
MNELLNKPERYDSVLSNSPRTIVKDIFAIVKIWIQNYRTRKQLKELPESLYDDLGIDRNMMKKESERPFWD